MKPIHISLLIILAFLIGAATVAIGINRNTIKHNKPIRFSEAANVAYNDDNATVVRALILEECTNTYCFLSKTQALVFRSGDSVWLDLETHTVSDTCKYGMRAVLTNP